MTMQMHKTEIWTEMFQGKPYEVQVTFKIMKTVRLRVVSGGQIRLSAPYHTSRSWLKQFLQEREEWIVTNVERMEGRKPSRGEGSDLNQMPEKAMASKKSMTVKERKNALEYLMPMVKQWHRVVAPYGIAMPHVTVRHMSSRYGSCSVGRGRITLAAVLLDVPKECAEYVVFHELTHFLYPNHSKEFYGFIQKYMPDYKVRETLLKKSSYRK